MMEYLKLIGIVIVIVGFALKLDSILIIFLAAVSTALVGGLGVGGLLENLGSNFVSNRSMAIFIIILLVTGTLERGCGLYPQIQECDRRKAGMHLWSHAFLFWCV